MLITFLDLCYNKNIKYILLFYMNTNSLDSIIEKAASITKNSQKSNELKNMEGGAKRLGRPPKKSSKNKKQSKKPLKKSSKKPLKRPSKRMSQKSSKKSSKKVLKRPSKKEQKKRTKKNSKKLKK